jgi:hypothetical protein
LFDAHAVRSATVRASAISIIACLGRLTDPVAAIIGRIDATRAAVPANARTTTASADGARFATRAGRSPRASGIHPIVADPVSPAARHSQDQDQHQGQSSI